MAANTWYVDGDVGDDTNAGTSPGVGNAFATIHKGLQSVILGNDKVYIKSTVTYNEAATMSTFITNSEAPITIEGYDTTPGDGGIVTMDGEDTLTYGLTAVRNYYIFRNIKIINYSSYAFNMSNADGCRWENCEASDNGIYGFYADNYCTFIDCIANNNRSGFYADQYCNAIRCTALDNEQYAIVFRGYVSFVKDCILRGGNIFILWATGAMLAINNTIDGEGVNKGINMGSSGYMNMILINNIIYDCTTAITGPTTEYPTNIGLNNLLYSNTLDYVGWSDTDNDITGDPAFVNEASDDYSLGSGSAAIGTAFPDLNGEERTDIGALQTALPSGGTSRVILTS